jgi:hypothetical protein
MAVIPAFGGIAASGISTGGRGMRSAVVDGHHSDLVQMTNQHIQHMHKA